MKPLAEAPAQGSREVCVLQPDRSEEAHRLLTGARAETCGQRNLTRAGAQTLLPGRHEETHRLLTGARAETRGRQKLTREEPRTVLTERAPGAVQIAP